eukprot:TRINITY_DN1508_c0_g2_i1.p1 TRINITY_DN1508_c0_g2~~TRINITY_DN1508_c0_g2_i1.p1  ORF type:complete len:400 (+),score=164.35 TRINITY_DN1508_c0_g2_i1:167-1366(+)
MSVAPAEQLVDIEDGQGDRAPEQPPRPPRSMQRQPTIAEFAKKVATSWVKPPTREAEEQRRLQERKLKRQQTKARLKAEASSKKADEDPAAAGEGAPKKMKRWLSQLAMLNKDPRRKVTLKLTPDEAAEDLDEDPEDKEYRPIVMVITALFYTIILIASIWYNGGFEPFAVNPFFGPSEKTLIYFGAKYTPIMVDKQQYWRFLTAMWLHVGVIHFVLYMFTQYRNGIPLEREIGHWRVTLVYFISAIGGTLFSAIMVPNLVSVGPSGALMGVLGISIVDVAQNWEYRENPQKEMLNLIVTLVIALVLGLLPSIDNFAHVGGFVCGIFSGMVFSPNIHFKLRKTFVTFLGVLGLLAYFVATLAVFFLRVSPATEWCDACTTIECLPVLDWCGAVDTTGLF